MSRQKVLVEPRGEQAPAQSVLDAVRAAYPNEKLGRVRLPREGRAEAIGIV
jgi:uncharacterized iron-regulated membrane protein